MSHSKKQAEIDRTRVRAFIVPHEQLRAIFNGRVELVGPALPKDAHVDHVAEDLYRRVFVVFLHSMTFDPVPSGQVPPIVGNLQVKPVPLRITPDVLDEKPQPVIHVHPPSFIKLGD